MEVQEEGDAVTTIADGPATVWVIDTVAKTAVSDPTKLTLVADAFELGDLGFKHQITKLRCNRVEWNFAPGYLAFVTTCEYLSQVLTRVPTDSVIFASSAITAQTSTTFTIEYLIAGNTKMVVKGSMASGQMEVWVDSMVIDPASTPTLLTHSVHHTAIRPLVSPPNADSTTCHALLPYSSGEMIRNAKTSVRTVGVLSPVPAADYPGFRRTYPGTDYKAGSGFQLSAVWDTSTNQCLAMRIKNPNMRGTAWEFTGTGTAVSFAFLDYPNNNIQTQSATMATRVILRPMKGNWFDACEWYRTEQQSASAVWLGRGKIHSASDYGEARKEADYFISLAPGNDSPPELVTNDGNKWQRCYDEILRLRAWMGPDVRIYAHWGTWMQNPVYSWPGHFPAQSSAVQIIVSAASLPNVYCGLYTFPLIVDPTGDFWGLDPVGNALLVQLNEAQLPYEEAYAGSLARDHYLWQWGNTDARRQMVLHLADAHSEFDGQIRGIYFDTTSGASTNGDYRNALSASQKGPGSPYNHEGTAAFIQEVKDEFFGLMGSRMSVIGEFFAEQLIHKVDSQGGYLALYPDILDFAIMVPAYQTIYGEYVHRWDFATGGLDSVRADTYDDWLIHMWTQARQFHAGMLMGQQYSGSPDSKLWMVPGPTDTQPLHASLNVYQCAKMMFHRACAQALRTFDLRKYFRGRRLRPPIDSSEYRLEKYGYEVGTDTPFSGGHSQVTILNQPVDVSVHISDELDAIGIVFTNFNVSSETFTLRLHNDTHPQIAPYEYLHVRESDGSRTFVERQQGGLTLEVTIPPSSVVVYELLREEE